MSTPFTKNYHPNAAIFLIISLELILLLSYNILEYGLVFLMGDFILKNTFVFDTDDAEIVRQLSLAERVSEILKSRYSKKPLDVSKTSVIPSDLKVFLPLWVTALPKL